MTDVCPKCGLPKELCVCETIAKESQRIKIVSEKRKYGKVITVIYGIDKKEIDIKDLAKKLKSKFACGGTYKENTIELQGEHVLAVRDELIKLGFPKETISTNK